MAVVQPKSFSKITFQDLNVASEDAKHRVRLWNEATILLVRLWRQIIKDLLVNPG